MSELLVGPPCAGITAVEVDNDVCVYSPVTNQVLLLNESASCIWYLCDGTRTSEEIAEVLSRTYRAPVETVKAHVERAICSFTRARLLVSP